MASHLLKLDTFESLDEETREEGETEAKEEAGDAAEIEAARVSFERQRRLALNTFITLLECDPEPSVYDLTELDFDEIVSWQVPGFMGRRDN